MKPISEERILQLSTDGLSKGADVGTRSEWKDIAAYWREALDAEVRKRNTLIAAFQQVIIDDLNARR